MRPNPWISAFIIVLVLLGILLLTGCKTTETVTVYEPVFPTWEGYDDVIGQRPLPVQGLVMPSNLSEICHNSLMFQVSYREWKSYAELVEDYLTQVKQEYTP